MKKYFFMDCDTVLGLIYESDEDNSLSFVNQVQKELHLLLCPHCARKMRDLKRLEEVMKIDFFPPAPDLEAAIMERIYIEAAASDISEDKIDAPTGISFRGWVIIGFFLLISLPSSFFGMNFIEIANEEGLSFLLPVGITIGIAVTCYGALFIGSHLKELSNRFGLR